MREPLTTQRAAGRPAHALGAVRRARPSTSTYRMNDGMSGQPGAMFVFFSNRLGCFGSLLVSAALTLVLLLILNVI